MAKEYKVRSNYEGNEDFIDEKAAKIVSQILYKKLQSREKEMERFKEILQDDNIKLTL